MQQISNNTEAKNLGLILLDIGIALLSSGASISRIRVTMNRIAHAFDYETDINIQHKSISLTLNNDEDIPQFNGMRSTSSQVINFKLISGISRMSWDVVKNNLSVEDIKTELNRLTSLPHYPRLVVLILVSLAGSAFCFSFGGNYTEMAITFGATFFGLFVRQEAAKKKFNLYFCVFFAALAASLFSGVFIKLGLTTNAEHAFATSVLFLVPGIPLINSFTDLIDGNIQNGLVRGTNGLMIAFAIALGLLVAMNIYGITGDVQTPHQAIAFNWWIILLQKCIWFGLGALGFGILFNAPPRTLFTLWLGGAVGGLVKTLTFQYTGSVVMAAFAGATAVGILSIPIAHYRHVPPMIFAIPSVIPFVPGVFAYRTMLGFIKLTGTVGADYNFILSDTVNNGMKTLFILMSLAVGVAIPMHVMRKESVKNIRIKIK